MTIMTVLSVVDRSTNYVRFPRKMSSHEKNDDHEAEKLKSEKMLPM